MDDIVSGDEASLALGAGRIFQGESTVAIAKALLQSGVSWIAGVSSEPFAPLFGALRQSGALLQELGVDFRLTATEAAAGAMAEISAGHAVRGALVLGAVGVTGNATAALSWLAATGVTGGVLVIAGEESCENRDGLRESVLAGAMKSQYVLLDPRPDLQSLVAAVERGFELSEAGRLPVMLYLREGACRTWGSFICRENVAPRVSLRQPLPDGAAHSRSASEAVSGRGSRESRLAAALAFIQSQRINEIVPGRLGQVGIILQGGLFNSVMRSLRRLSLADGCGASDVPLLVLNATCPLVPEDVRRFCSGKRAVLIVEENRPGFIEDAVNGVLRRADNESTFLVGRETLPASGNYDSTVLLRGIGRFLQLAMPDGLDLDRVGAALEREMQAGRRCEEILPVPMPIRRGLPCAGCVARAVFSALKLVEQRHGGLLVRAGQDCIAAMEQFEFAATATGIATADAGGSALARFMRTRVISVDSERNLRRGAPTGDGDVVLVIISGGCGLCGEPGAPGHDLDSMLAGIGVRWRRRVAGDDVAAMTSALSEALASAERGLKVVVAEAGRALQNRGGEGGAARVRYGIDAGLRADSAGCMALSGCPALTLRQTDDLLEEGPMPCISDDCVGCGQCAQVVLAADLAPSFYRAIWYRNPSLTQRLLARTRRFVIDSIAKRAATGEGRD